MKQVGSFRAILGGLEITHSGDTKAGKQAAIADHNHRSFERPPSEKGLGFEMAISKGLNSGG
jgi:hypothetical protein